MDLYSWIDQSGYLTAAWADRWGVQYSTLSNIARYKSRASYDVGVKIVAGTAGAVTLAEVCGPAPSPLPSFPDKRYQKRAVTPAAPVPSSAAARRAAPAPAPKRVRTPKPAPAAAVATPKPKRAPKPAAAAAEPARGRGRPKVRIPADYVPPAPAAAPARRAKQVA
jgi:hypothetical protein